MIEPGHCRVDRAWLWGSCMWEGAKGYNWTCIYRAVWMARGQQPNLIFIQGMKCNHILSWAALLVATGSFLAHPITDSAEMPYPGAGKETVTSTFRDSSTWFPGCNVTVWVCVPSVSVEDHGMGPLDDLSLPEQSFSPQDVAAALRFSTLLSGDFNRDGKSTTF